MIEWLVDHVNVVYVLLALVFIGVGVLFWQTKRVRELLAMVIIVAVGLLVWYLCSLVVTDRKQIRVNMHDLAQAVLDGRPEKMAPLLANRKYGGQTRAQTAENVVQLAKSYGVSGFAITGFEVEKLTRDKDMGRAEATFMLGVDARDHRHMLRCSATFVLEGRTWCLESFACSNPVVDSETKIVRYAPDPE